MRSLFSDTSHRHPSESWDLLKESGKLREIPAFAGMTIAMGGHA